jgi:hypothetical protein
MASFKLINKILLPINNKLMVSGIFCNLEKAFDCVNHSILLSKLELYGIAGVFKALITSYLCVRYQKSGIRQQKTHNSTLSNWEIIKHGVPQGTILGLLLFLFYINDLPNVMINQAKIISYADDTNVIIPNSSLQELETDMNNQFVAINEWFKDNLLSLNLKNSLSSI